MRCPTLNDLPPPPPGRTGWPWTEECPQLPDLMSDGRAWPRISVVTPNYNYGRFIEETIRSVLLQGYPNLEFIVIDGGSTDESIEIIRKYSAWMAYWGSEPDSGPSHKVNKGFRMAKGEIAAQLNSDDTYLPEALSRVAPVFGEAARHAFVFGNCRSARESGEPIQLIKPSCKSLESFLLFQTRILQPAVFFRRVVLEEVGFLDESYCYAMDFDLFMRIAAKHRVHHLDFPLATLRIHPSSESSRGIVPARKAYVEAARRYWGPPWKPRYYRYLVASWRYIGYSYLVEAYRAMGRDRRVALRHMSRAVCVYPPYLFGWLVFSLLVKLLIGEERAIALKKWFDSRVRVSRVRQKPGWAEVTKMHVVVDGLPLLGAGGTTTYLRDLILHLSVEGKQHDYSLFFRGFRKDIRRKVTQLMADPTFARFPVTTTLIPNRLLEGCWTQRSWYIPFTKSWLGRPDIFLSTVYVTPVLRTAPIVMLVYDLIPLRFPQFYERDHVAFALRMRRGIERAAALIAISECTKRDLVDMVGADPRRVHVVYPGMDARFGASTACASGRHEAVRARYGLRRPYLLYVGTLAAYKNVGTLVKVFRRMKQVRRIPHQLVLCGRTRWGREVVDAAQDLIEAGDCVVTDFIPACDVPSVYHGAEAFAFLSLYEGFGLPPLEAMACGVPVVVSNASSLPEVVGDAGLLVPPTDEEAIEHALYRVLTDSELRQELRRRGFLQAAKFSWSETARQTLAVFNRVRGVS